MSVLALRFAGSHQSWGSSAFLARNTEATPTRSAVTGMLAAALGWKHSRQEKWMDELVVHARVDRPGRQVEDFHTVAPPPADVAVARSRTRLLSTGKAARADHVVVNYDGAAWKTAGVPATLVTRRRYLADAEFLVTLSHPDPARVAELAVATRNPVFMPYLGRKACAPAFPFHLGTFSGTPVEVLSAVPSRSPNPLRVHAVTGDRNAASFMVEPPVVATLDDVMSAAAALRI